MTIFKFPIFRHERNWSFPAIRSKPAIIRIWLQSSLKILSNIESKDLNQIGTLWVSKSPFRRLVFDSPDARYSIGFPFAINHIDGNDFALSFLSYEVTHELLYQLLEVFSNEELFLSNNFEPFFDSILSLQNDGSSIWEIARELLMYEDAYLRQDHDQQNENGRLHPLDHIDVGYSNLSTYKIGLPKCISTRDLINMFDLDTDAYFLENLFPEA